jgi:hypothetical protein
MSRKKIEVLWSAVVVVVHLQSQYMIVAQALIVLCVLAVEIGVILYMNRIWRIRHANEYVSE